MKRLLLLLVLTAATPGCVVQPDPVIVYRHIQDYQDLGPGWCSWSWNGHQFLQHTWVNGTGTCYETIHLCHAHPTAEVTPKAPSATVQKPDPPLSTPAP